MYISAIGGQYLPNRKVGYTNSAVNFNGRTNFYAFTDIHQNAEKHCKFVWEILQKADKNRTVILDNGDIFKGLFPKYTIMHTYSRAKKASPELEIVYNLGNNDPGFMETDRVLFRKYLNILNRSGVKTISANVIDETTGKIPKGIRPYALVERDGDKLLYVGFVVDKLEQYFAGMKTIDPIKALEDLAPELKNVMKKNDCKGMVMMVHDKEATALKLSKKAKELGLEHEFILGGHVHHTYIDEEDRIFYPEPFRKSMINFDLNIDKKAHKLSFLNEIFSDNCKTGIFAKEIERAKQNEKFNEPVAKSVTALKFNSQDADNLKFTQLGTLYADGIRGITKSDIGFVPKSWIYDTLPKKDGDITKLDILLCCPQPFRNIVQVHMTPDELRNFYQFDISDKSKLFEASRNFELTLDKNNLIKQICINGEPLFDNQRVARDPKKIITVAIDAHTAEKITSPKKETRSLMYNGIVYGLQKLEKELKPNEEYPITKLIKE